MYHANKVTKDIYIYIYIYIYVWMLRAIETKNWVVIELYHHDEKNTNEYITFLN